MSKPAKIILLSLLTSLLLIACGNTTSTNTSTDTNSIPDNYVPFTYPEEGISLYHPEEWEVRTYDNTVILTLDQSKREDRYIRLINIEISSQPLNEELANKDLATLLNESIMSINDFREIMGDDSLPISHSPVSLTISNYDALQQLLVQELDNLMGGTWSITVFQTEDRKFEITVLGDQNSYSDHEADIEAIFNSLEITPPTTE